MDWFEKLHFQLVVRSACWKKQSRAIPRQKIRNVKAVLVRV